MIEAPGLGAQADRIRTSCSLVGKVRDCSGHCHLSAFPNTVRRERDLAGCDHDRHDRDGTAHAPAVVTIMLDGVGGHPNVGRTGVETAILDTARWRRGGRRYPRAERAGPTLLLDVIAALPAQQAATDLVR